MYVNDERGEGRGDRGNEKQMQRKEKTLDKRSTVFMVPFSGSFCFVS